MSKEAIQYIKATLTAFAPDESISMTQETWAKLHEAMKALAEQPAQQEPVGEAYLCDICQTPFDGAYECPSCGHNTAVKEPVYTSPPQRKPLTEYQKWRMYEAGPDIPSTAAGVYMRAVDDTESAHGIKENT